MRPLNYPIVNMEKKVLVNLTTLRAYHSRLLCEPGIDTVKPYSINQAWVLFNLTLLTSI